MYENFRLVRHFTPESARCVVLDKRHSQVSVMPKKKRKSSEHISEINPKRPKPSQTWLKPTFFDGDLHRPLSLSWSLIHIYIFCCRDQRRTRVSPAFFSTLTNIIIIANLIYIYTFFAGCHIYPSKWRKLTSMKTIHLSAEEVDSKESDRTSYQHHHKNHHKDHHSPPHIKNSRTPHNFSHG